MLYSGHIIFILCQREAVILIAKSYQFTSNCTGNYITIWIVKSYFNQMYASSIYTYANKMHRIKLATDLERKKGSSAQLWNQYSKTKLWNKNSTGRIYFDTEKRDEFIP